MKIVQEDCIGCGICETLYPELFQVDKGKCILKKVNKRKMHLVLRAEKECPTGCIRL